MSRIELAPAQRPLQCGPMEDLIAALGLPEQRPWILTAVSVLLLVLAAWLADFIARRVLLGRMQRLIERSSNQWDDALVRHGVLRWAAHIAPAAVLQFGVLWLPGLPPELVQLLRNLALAFTILMLVLALSALLSAGNDIYERNERARARPIRGYIQLVKIFLFVIAAILIVAVLIERSPLLLLSGLGAMTAVLLLVFKDTILSFVAGIQIASYDMVRVGDWIEMPALGADGDVIEMGLHTVKVQNWDRTITAIPTWRLATESFRNWRGMSDSGGRRIKRALRIDAASIHFLSAEELDRLRQFDLLKPYLQRKQAELAEWNAQHSGEINQRRLTNIGTFRAYVAAYLRAHAGLRQDMTQIVRQLEPTPEGLPLEVYCFVADTRWAEYEGVMADLFNHLFAIAGAFGLRVFQQPSGNDLREALAGGQPGADLPSDRAGG